MDEMLNQHQAVRTPNVLLIDADYADRLVFQLSVQLERMLERRMPKVEMARWIDYLVLDGSLRPSKDNVTQVVFIYTKSKFRLQNFMPASLSENWNGWSFNDNLGLFQCASFPVEDEITTCGKFYADSVASILAQKEVQRLWLVPDLEEYGMQLKRVVGRVMQPDITVFASEPVAGLSVKQEIITYSLLAALDVKSEELTGEKSEI